MNSAKKLSVGATSKASEKPRRFGAIVRDLLIAREVVTPMGSPDWMNFATQLEDVHYESLRKAVTGERWPGTKIMESVAAYLGVDPSIFPEYQLWLAQRAFDPKEVGEDEAYANLSKWVADQG
jgi:hypothetical protein